MLKFLEIGKACDFDRDSRLKNLSSLAEVEMISADVGSDQR